jgi:hypothetical protein
VSLNHHDLASNAESRSPRLQYQGEAPQWGVIGDRRSMAHFSLSRVQLQ